LFGAGFIVALQDVIASFAGFMAIGFSEALAPISADLNKALAVRLQPHTTLLLPKQEREPGV
jgi:hypothetical protein